ncbi:hypothetical protein BDN72DRAFT_896231 [Pluteus cervinus]|uniref:Uncharacterized protein n=1 Tax=Pluteus cervinus TaxID=181527 RepID=A0ACD3AY38_9AGAR|nr:hypothetical protein BDN72DRAFT_896231 [Pluteus cervinus]
MPPKKDKYWTYLETNNESELSDIETTPTPGPSSAAPRRRYPPRATRTTWRMPSLDELDSSEYEEPPRDARSESESETPAPLMQKRKPGRPRKQPDVAKGKQKENARIGPVASTSRIPPRSNPRLKLGVEIPARVKPAQDNPRLSEPPQRNATPGPSTVPGNNSAPVPQESMQLPFPMLLGPQWQQAAAQLAVQTEILRSMGLGQLYGLYPSPQQLQMPPPPHAALLRAMGYNIPPPLGLGLPPFMFNEAGKPNVPPIPAPAAPTQAQLNRTPISTQMKACPLPAIRRPHVPNPQTEPYPPNVARQQPAGLGRRASSQARGNHYDMPIKIEDSDIEGTPGPSRARKRLRSPDDDGPSSSKKQHGLGKEHRCVHHCPPECQHGNTHDG